MQCHASAAAPPPKTGSRSSLLQFVLGQRFQVWQIGEIASLAEVFLSEPQIAPAFFGQAQIVVGERAPMGVVGEGLKSCRGVIEVALFEAHHPHVVGKRRFVHTAALCVRKQCCGIFKSTGASCRKTGSVGVIASLGVDTAECRRQQQEP
jgi:hypothetical protein